MYVNRNEAGQVTGIFCQEQYPGQETVAANHSDIEAYRAAKSARAAEGNKVLETRVAELEAKVKIVEAKAEIAK